MVQIEHHRLISRFASDHHFNGYRKSETGIVSSWFRWEARYTVGPHARAESCTARYGMHPMCRVCICNNWSLIKIRYILHRWRIVAHAATFRIAIFAWFWIWSSISVAGNWNTGWDAQFHGNGQIWTEIWAWKGTFLSQVAFARRWLIVFTFAP